MTKQIEKQEIEELTNELVFTKNYGTLDAVAKYLYEIGYRKQSEGKWVGTHNLRHCSKCGNVVNFNNVSSWLYNYCPHCGAHMKGGAE